MKFKTLILVFLLMLAGIYASAEDEYVVKLKRPAQMLSLPDENTKDCYVTGSWDDVQQYLEADVVEYYEPVMYARYLGTPNWQVLSTNGTFAEKLGVQGCNVKVAVIDGGMNAYEAISSRVLEGYDFYEKTTDVTDENGHGTFVASMIALEGSAFACESYIVPLKVFYAITDLNGNYVYDDNGNKQYTAKSSDVARAIRAAVDTYGCDVINLSLSFYSAPLTVKEAVNYAIDKGAIVVAAAGNDGNSTYHYPAAFPNVTGVGSSDSNDEVAFFSQRNDSVHVVAPGQSVIVSPRVGVNNIGSGTSFSAPQVSALAAVARCINPEITNAEFMELLKTTSVHPDDIDPNDNIYTYDVNYGYGIIDCRAFIKKMIDDRDAFISPIKVKNGQAYSLVYNNTEADLTAKGIIVTGDNVIEITDLFIEYDNVQPLSGDYTEGEVKHMVWDGFTKLVPLSPVSVK